MDKRAQLAAMFRQKDPAAGMILFTARVVGTDGRTCTIDYDGLHLSDVRLTPTTTGNDDTVLVTPAEGSSVLVGSLTGDLNNLCVLAADRAEKIEIRCGEVSTVMDSSGIVLNDGQLGGAVIVGKMVEWMQKVHSDMAKLKTLLAGTKLASNGALLPIMFDPETPAPKVSDFENTKLKQ